MITYFYQKKEQYLTIENGCAPSVLTEKDLKITLNDPRLRAAIKQWEFLAEKQIDVHEGFMKKPQALMERIKTEKDNQRRTGGEKL